MLIVGTFNVIAQYTVEAFNVPSVQKLGVLQGIGFIVLLWIVGIVLFKSFEKWFIKYFYLDKK